MSGRLQLAERLEGLEVVDEDCELVAVVSRLGRLVERRLDLMIRGCFSVDFCVAQWANFPVDLKFWERASLF